MNKTFTFIEEGMPNSGEEYLSAVRIINAEPFDKGKRRGLIVTYDDTPVEPDDDCALLFPVFTKKPNESVVCNMYAYYNGATYRIDRLVINRSTLELLEDLSKCDQALLEALSLPASFEYH